MFDNSVHKRKNNGIKLCIRIHRLLGKYKEDKDSNIIQLEENTPNKEFGKNYVTNKEKGAKIIYKQLYKNSLNTANVHKQGNRNKSRIFETKKYSYLEKKIFKELDYVYFLKKNRAISDKTYEKILYKKFKLRFVLPLLLLVLLSISVILDIYGNCGLVRGLSEFLKVIPILDTDWRKNLGISLLNTPPFNWLLKSVSAIEINTETRKVTVSLVTYNFFYLVIYFVLFFMLGVVLISGVIYYHKKVKKYEKIKFRKR
ncbi:Plasmodium exported protein (Pm-fam-a like), unknown function [Plasmodium malariae]|uniref:Fam-l protein n=1 Tax=Plasmodium malariae TaxID=5858 RepID=A0A1A8WZ76_PLAMA|nr:Plasmodium exported protein (Pm-fam-a like), unknown function [Plasmodium malariae]